MTDLDEARKRLEKVVAEFSDDGHPDDIRTVLDALSDAEALLARVRQRNALDLDTEDDDSEFHQGIRHAAHNMAEILDPDPDLKTETTENVVYVHRYEYRALDEHGDWSEPRILYHNLTVSENQARRRHTECKDYEHRFGRKFEGVYGYSGRNDTLIRRTITTTISDEELA